MRPIRRRRLTSALTLLEVLMVIAIIGILAARLLPALAKAKPRAWQVQCVGNLKSIGAGFHLYAGDHDHKFPMQVPMVEGGTMELVRSPHAFRHLQVLSNELSNPKVLICPADDRLTAASFATLANSNLSFFVGVDSQPSSPNSLLAGDRNITEDGIQQSNVLTTNFASNVRWMTNIHRTRGNILFADGHVSQLNSEGLQDAFKAASPGGK